MSILFAHTSLLRLFPSQKATKHPTVEKITKYFFPFRFTLVYIDAFWTKHNSLVLRTSIYMVQRNRRNVIRSGVKKMYELINLKFESLSTAIKANNTGSVTIW